MKILTRLPFELLFWIAALLLLGVANLNADGHEAHFTLCPLASMGFNWCPGCGIGRSIGHLLQGNIQASIDEHWFGIPALLIIGNRILVLLIINLKNRKVLNLKYKEKRYV